jgi:hypothetical protein
MPTGGAASFVITQDPLATTDDAAATALEAGLRGEFNGAPTRSSVVSLGEAQLAVRPTHSRSSGPKVPPPRPA